MRAGRLEQCAAVATLLDAPATDYVAALFARAAGTSPRVPA
jgi:ABC-type proline/glycine betaine transport system ATPase subunit